MMADFNVAVRYQFHTFPACEKAVMTDYPKRNFLSFLLAVNYVYPALKKFLAVRLHLHMSTRTPGHS